jgi:putative ABC transport system ATP-binding protein
MSDTPLIKMEGLTKVLLTDEDETHAIAGIDLEVRRGEYLSIEGPSGCSTPQATAPTC